MTQSFYSWMRQFKDEDTARGDLARDMIADTKHFPKNMKREGLRKYLRGHPVVTSIFEKSYQQFLDDTGIFVEGSKEYKNAELEKRFGEPIGYLRGTPILRAVKRLDWPPGWRVYCKYCLGWHLHGMTEKHNLSHRCSHCSSYGYDFWDKRETSKYIHGGYYLLTEPIWPIKKSDKIFSKSKERTRKHFVDDET